MKTSRVCTLGALIIAALVPRASADEGGGAQAVVLDTFSRVWIEGDQLGPTDGTLPRLEKNTGAGIMDANVAFDRTAAQSNPDELLLGTVFTRSALQPNRSNSYLQGGFALAKLTAKGVELGPRIDLPELEGQRAFMRPLIGFTPNHAVILAASEDNAVNANPKPVVFVADKAAGGLVPIANSTRPGDPTKPTNLVVQALADLGRAAVTDPGGQRSPHSIVPVGERSFVVALQHNNNATEAFRFTVTPDAAVHVDWWQRFSDTAQHARPQIAITPDATTGFMTAVEARQQPAEIGIRLTKFDVASGGPIASKIVIHADPASGNYVAEPSIGLAGDKVAIGYAMVAPIRHKAAANAAGHAGGSGVAFVGLFDATSLDPIGDPLAGAAPFSRHAHLFATEFGANREPAVAYIAGSSTGMQGASEQLLTLGDHGIAAKDPQKVFAVSTFSDVANVQARGKGNPQNQAKGFINGLGAVPNPGFGKGNQAFMPEVRSFSISTITGYTDSAAAALGRRNSLWLSLVPASWQEGLTVVPGKPTDKPGANADGTGPAQPVDAGAPPATAHALSRGTSGDAGCGCGVLGSTRLEPKVELPPDRALLLFAALGAVAMARARRRTASGAADLRRPES
jgi:hypothetical protein